MERFEPYTSLGLSLLVGLLLGVEREQSRPREAGRAFFGGIRTYPLVALTGAVATLLSGQLGPWPLVVGGAGLVTLLAVGYFRDSSAGHPGATTELSALLTYLLGALSAADVIQPFEKRVFIIAAVAVVATVLLSLKPQLQRFTSTLSNEDVFATLKFLVLAVVILPLLPDQGFGPWEVLNPFSIGVFVCLIAGVDFVGYLAMRFLGANRGMLVTGAIGGLASSTAVTLAAAGRAKETPLIAPLAAISALVASSVMFARLLVVLAAVEARLMQSLLLPMGVMAAVMLGGTGLVYFREGRRHQAASEVKLSNPFELSAALKFGAFFVGVLLVSRWAQQTFGSGGSYVTGALAGLTDVDAISLSMARLVKSGQVDVQVARTTVVIAASANTVTKSLMALVLGGRAMGVRVGVVSVVALVAGLVLIAVT